MADHDFPIAAYAKVVKRAWNDPAFKAKLVANPSASLAAMGVPVAPGMTIKVVEDTDRLIHLVLPAPSHEDELEDEALDLVAGGMANVIVKAVTG